MEHGGGGRAAAASVRSVMRARRARMARATSRCGYGALLPTIDYIWLMAVWGGGGAEKPAPRKPVSPITDLAARPTATAAHSI